MNHRGTEAQGTMDDETRRLLLQAKEEISSLRRANEILGAKVEVMELFACVLHTDPARRSQGMGEDICWKIDMKIAGDDMTIAAGAGAADVSEGNA